MKKLFYFLLPLLSAACSHTQTQEPVFYLGADLSYLNEMLDCGGTFRSKGNLVEPYAFFASKGTNLVRLRLWHNPDWTNYSNYPDVERAITAAKRNRMQVLLDFHYSDHWADPHKQQIPKAWENIADVNTLGDSVYQYTFTTLMRLHAKNLLPEFVQVGNETNMEILVNTPPGETHQGLDWPRNAFLLNKGLQAVRDASLATKKPIQSMLHIAQPENALWWFKQATENQVNNFDWIALSYYPKWSSFGFDKLAYALDSLKRTYHKRIIIVETAYPYGFVDIDSAANILGQDALIPGYPATPQGQLAYMQNLVQIVKKGGGEGVIYWEPAWISTPCHTLWGQGSHWENATFFDAKNQNEALPVFEFFSGCSGSE